MIGESNDRPTSETPRMAPGGLRFGGPEFVERCMGNTSIALTILEKFETQLRDNAREMSDQLERKDAVNLARTAHALKGAAGAVAASALMTLAGELEMLARQDQLDASLQAFSRLKAELDSCVECLPAIRSSISKAAL